MDFKKTKNIISGLALMSLTACFNTTGVEKAITDSILDDKDDGSTYDESALLGRLSSDNQDVLDQSLTDEGYSRASHYDAENHYQYAKDVGDTTQASYENLMAEKVDNSPIYIPMIATGYTVESSASSAVAGAKVAMDMYKEGDQQKVTLGAKIGDKTFAVTKDLSWSASNEVTTELLNSDVLFTTNSYVIAGVWTYENEGKTHYLSYSGGMLTEENNRPTTGVVTYTGPAVGVKLLADNSAAGERGMGQMMMSLNFDELQTADGTTAGSSTANLTMKYGDAAIASSEGGGGTIPDPADSYIFSFTNIALKGDTFIGTLNTSDTLNTNTANGSGSIAINIYGGSGGHAAGTWKLQDSDSNKHSGAFAATKQDMPTLPNAPTN